MLKLIKGQESQRVESTEEGEKGKNELYVFITEMLPDSFLISQNWIKKYHDKNVYFISFFGKHRNKVNNEMIKIFNSKYNLTNKK